MYSIIALNSDYTKFEKVFKDYDNYREARKKTNSLDPLAQAKVVAELTVEKAIKLNNDLI